MTYQPTDRPSTPSLIGGAIRQATELFATEIALVRLEATEKLTLALVSVASVVVAAVFMIVALIFLLQGLVELLIRAGFPAFQASFMVGGVLAILGLIAVIIAARNLCGARLKPTRVMGQIHAAKTMARKRGIAS